MDPRPMVLDLLGPGQDPAKPNSYVVTLDLSASFRDVFSAQEFAELRTLKSAETLESIGDSVPVKITNLDTPVETHMTNVFTLTA